MNLTVCILLHLYMQMMLVHAHPVTVLQFSDDGKLLATYAYGDSMLSVWQVQPFSLCVLGSDLYAFLDIVTDTVTFVTGYAKRDQIPQNLLLLYSRL